MSTIEFKDQNGNAIGQAVVPDIELSGQSKLSHLPKSRQAVFIICKQTNKPIGVIDTDGNINVNAAGTTEPWLDVHLHNGQWNGKLISNDVMHPNVTGYLGRELPATFMSVAIPCIYCDNGHELSAQQSQVAFNEYTTNRKRVPIEI